MAESILPITGGVNYSSGGDSLSRADWDGQVARYEQRMTTRLVGLRIDRPAAEFEGRIYHATDESVFYWDTGTTWVWMGRAPGDQPLTTYTFNQPQTGATGWNGTSTGQLDKDRGLVRGWSYHLNGDNGPGWAPGQAVFVTAILPYPSGYTGPLGSYSYSDFNDGYVSAGGVVAVAGSTSAARLVGPAGGTSNQYRLRITWQYPAGA